MDKEIETCLDNLVRDLQNDIFSKRHQALGPSDLQKQEMFADMRAITYVNRNFKTHYLSFELGYMKVSDSQGIVYNELMSRLPLKEGDENIFEDEK